MSKENMYAERGNWSFRSSKVTKPYGKLQTTKITHEANSPLVTLSGLFGFCLLIDWFDEA